jgi:hypothetical protein
MLSASSIYLDYVIRQIWALESLQLNCIFFAYRENKNGKEDEGMLPWHVRELILKCIEEWCGNFIVQCDNDMID